MKRLVFFLLLLAAPVYAEPQPSSLWSYDTGSAVMDVAISPNGSIIAAGSGKAVYLLNKSGHLQWNASLDSVAISVAVTSKGDVAAGDEASLYLFNGTGTMIWEKYIGDDIRDIALYGDRIAVGSRTRKIYLFDLEGNKLWTYGADTSVQAVAITGENVAAGTSSGKVYLLDKNGELLWRYDARRFVSGVAFAGETLVVGHRYLSYLKDEELVGTYMPSAEVTSLDVAENYTLVGCEDGLVYSIDMNRRRLWTYNATKPSKVALAVDGGYIAVGAGDNVLLLTPPDTTPPLVKIVNPAKGATVTGVVKILATFDEPVDILQVFIDGNYACGSLPCNWDTAAASEGTHTITVRAIDASGNVGEDSRETTVKRTLIQNVTEAMREKKEAIEEKINVTIPPIEKPERYSSIKKALLLLAIVLILIAITKIKKKGKRKRYRYKK